MHEKNYKPRTQVKISDYPSIQSRVHAAVKKYGGKWDMSVDRFANLHGQKLIVKFEHLSKIRFFIESIRADIVIKQTKRGKDYRMFLIPNHKMNAYGKMVTYKFYIVAFETLG